MKFIVKTDASHTIDADCLLIALRPAKVENALSLSAEQKTRLPALSAKIDAACNGFLSQQIEAGNLPCEVGSCQLLLDCPNVASGRVLVVVLDETPEALQKGLTAALTQLRERGFQKVVLDLGDDCYSDEMERITRCAYHFAHAAYTFDSFRSEKEQEKSGIKTLIFHPQERRVDEIERALDTVQALLQGEHLVRDLGNTPANVCTPKHLARCGEDLAKEYEECLSVNVLKRKDIEELGMNALLAVAKGGEESPRFIVLEYCPKGEENRAPVVVAGKGVCFDSGGISLKPAAAMDEMKYDMSGAGTVLGLMQALCAAQVKTRVIGLIAAVENMPDGHATHPGDIVKTLNGQTVEILNTDAEGRLILCDALAYAKRFDPKYVIDLATLTGACVVALGYEYSGVLGNDQALIDELLKSGQQTGDLAWQLPLRKQDRQALKSPFADLANVSAGRAAGTISAAAFLSAFCDDYRWAHLDIAGTAWISDAANKGATARPLPLLFDFILRQA